MNRRSAVEHASLTTRGLIYMCVLLVSSWALIAGAQGKFSREAPITAQLVTVGDTMRPGALVKFRGLTVGTVQTVNLNPPGSDTPVSAVLRIHRKQLAHIPAGVTARVLPLTFLADSHVQLVEPKNKSGRSLQSGAQIPPATDNLTFLLQDAMDISTRLLAAVSPAKVATVISTIADTWEARGERLGETTSRQEAYLKRWEADLPTFRADLDLLAETLDAAAESAPDIVASLRNLAPVIRSFSQQFPSFETLLVRAARDAALVDDWVQRNADRIIYFVNATEPFWKSLDRNKIIFTDSVHKVRLALENANQFLQNSQSGGSLGLELAGGAGFAIDGYTADDCMRYPGVDGFPGLEAPNCGSGGGSNTFAASSSDFGAPFIGGNVGPVGSAQERQRVQEAFGRDGADAASAELFELYVAPLLRGRAVATP